LFVGEKDLEWSHQPDRESNLAARWPRQELAKPDKIGEGVFVDPFPSQDKLVAEVADVSDRTAVAPTFGGGLRRRQ
jgi:hypothetical protein